MGGTVGALLDAVSAGDVDAARARLDAGDDVLGTDGDPDGASPLHRAAERGPYAMVELLLTRGAKDWLQDKRGRVPLDLARHGTALDRDAIVRVLDRPVIDDPVFRAAVAAIRAGDPDGLRALLGAHPELARAHAIEPAFLQGYFTNPALIWFVACNPRLWPPPDRLPALADALIEAGQDRADLDYTLGLVLTTDAIPAAQRLTLLDRLLAAGATADDHAVRSIVAHKCLDEVRALLVRGHPLDAVIAAALGRMDALPALLADADPLTVHHALAAAVVNRELDAARACLDAGAPVDGWLPVHAHSTALHQAVANDDPAMIALLLARGARQDVKDTLWRGTPAGWAAHLGHAAAAAALQPPGHRANGHGER